MAGDLKGVNQFTSSSGSRNTIEDYSAVYRNLIPHEGIHSAIRVKPTGPTSSNIEVTLGFCSIDNGGSSLLTFRLKSSIASLAVPNLTNTGKHYLVVLKIDLTNATDEIEVVEGTVGTDPALTEGGSPEVYFLVLARIVDSGTIVVAGDIVQDGVTLTNNATPEIIGRFADDGFMPLNRDGAFASADAGVNTYTFIMDGDFTGMVQEGDKLQFTQTTDGVKYGFVTKVAVTANVTTFTVYTGTDFDIDNETLTSIGVSRARAPFGFPLSPAKWTQELSSSTDDQTPTPTQFVWTNPNSNSLDAPIGSFDAYYQAVLRGEVASSTLSTTNNSETDDEWTAFNGEGSVDSNSSVFRRKTIDSTVKTTYFLNAKSDNAGSSNVGFRGTLGATTIRFVIAYL